MEDMLVSANAGLRPPAAPDDDALPSPLIDPKPHPEPYGFTGPSGLFAPLFLKMLESPLFRNECYCDE